MQIYNLLTYYNQFSLQTNWSGEREPINYKLISGLLAKRYADLVLKTKNNKLQSGSTVWFSPFTEFPLYKFKDYVKSNDTKITRSKKLNNTVDTVILNSTIINKYYMTDQMYNRNGTFYVLDKQFFNDHIQQRIHHNPNYNQKVTNTYKTLNQDYVLINQQQLTNIAAVVKSMIETYPVVEGLLVGEEWGSNKAFQHAELFEQIINEYEQGNINIVFDDQINNDVNGGLEFDNDLFSTMLDMIGGNDEGNINIARELIANTNLELSRPYILFLFQLYPGLSKQNNTRSWKYVTDQFKEDKNRLCYDHLQLFISAFGSKYPEHIPTIFQLMAIYFNKQWKNEVIKEIKVS
jgi:hypothetical protein